ncbi:MAG: YeeE/YedE family protein [Pseudomonadota bacterium]
MPEIPIKILVATLAFVLGFAFGATAQRTNFCTMGAISDLVVMGDYRRFRAWLLAIALAILGSQTLHLAGAIDLDTSIYLAPSLGWLGAVTGGLMFGFGMTLAGGCGSKSLVRVGGGNLKSLVVVLVLGVFAMMTLRGLVALGRVNFIEPTNVNLAGAGLKAQGLADLLGAALGAPVTQVRWLVAAAAAIGLLWYCFKDADFRASPRNLAGGAIIGAVIPLGWWITGVAGVDEFEPTPLASLTFVAPVGEGLMYLMIFTGASINFGIAAVGGVILGSFLMSVATGSFRVEAFADKDDTIRHIAGGAIMGVGGVLALGCTIGQGITGMSTLAIGSLLAFLSIVAGGAYGVKYLEQGSFRGALRAMLARG